MDDEWPQVGDLVAVLGSITGLPHTWATVLETRDRNWDRHPYKEYRLYLWNSVGSHPAGFWLGKDRLAKPTLEDFGGRGTCRANGSRV